MRRNDIVKHKDPNSWFYGRVIRVLDSETVLWLNCGLHFHISKIVDLELHNDYKGYQEWTGDGDGIIKYYDRSRVLDDGYSHPVKFQRPARFVRMTTLRKLKQRASRYAKRDAWKTPLDYESIQRK